MTFLQAIFPLAALYFVLFAAISDLHSMRIPNWISLALLALFAIAIPFGVFPNLAGNLIVFGAAVVILGALYLTGVAGGGDVKLLAVLALWVGTSGIIPFLLVMSFMGGVMAAVGLVLVKNESLKKHAFKWTDSWLARIARGEKVVAYGVAIAVGFIAALTKTYLS
ncbi:MAG TPA: prepilin peptidase [Alphaproteobacteria bacterium]